MSKEFLHLITNLKLEKIKLQYNHYERIVRNVLWIASVLVAIILAATFKNELTFQYAVIVILAVGIVIALLLLPIAKKSDEATEKEIPALIQSVQKNRGRK